MHVVDITEIPAFLTPHSCIAGLDFGKKNIGLAVSDLGLQLANPRPVLRRTKFAKDAEKLLAFFQKENTALAVIGLPFNMNGSFGPRVQATHAFVRNMGTLTNLPFAYWDERLSSIAAERSLLSMDMSRTRLSQRIDSAAAAFILQGALDRLRNSK